MKEFIKCSLIEFAVITLVVTLFEGIDFNEWRIFINLGEILLVVILFRLCYAFIDKLQNRFYILDVVIEFCIAMFLVLFFGYIFGWYKLNKIGNMCLMGVVVYVICYILGVVGSKKNEKYINSQLEKRRKRIEALKENNDTEL